MNVEIKYLSTKASSEEFDRVEEMFEDLYSYLETKGLTVPIVKKGGGIWLDSVRSSLDRLSVIAVALVHEEIVGFCAGNIRLTPAYLGSIKIGRVSQLYIEPDYRSMGIGVDLIKGVEKWFKMKNTSFVESEVLPDNRKAYKLWEKLGYKTDHIKMIKNE